MYLYSIIVPRGENFGLKWAQKARNGEIFVQDVYSNISQNERNPLEGRIGINDSIIKVGDHTLDALDDLQDIIKLIKEPADQYPVRIVFRESSPVKNTPVLF
tara:strand:- start:56 stop:361 length:306 start_codon:yes stop_codon:yes gene_type:complete